jgi:hypothetical protein
MPLGYNIIITVKRKIDQMSRIRTPLVVIDIAISDLVQCLSHDKLSHDKLA